MQTQRFTRGNGEYLIDFWAGLDTWCRVGLSFIGASALVLVASTIVGS